MSPALVIQNFSAIAFSFSTLCDTATRPGGVAQPTAAGPRVVPPRQGPPAPCAPVPPTPTIPPPRDAVFSISGRLSRHMTRSRANLRPWGPGRAPGRFECGRVENGSHLCPRLSELHLVQVVSHFRCGRDTRELRMRRQVATAGYPRRALVDFTRVGRSRRTDGTLQAVIEGKKKRRRDRPGRGRRNRATGGGRGLGVGACMWASAWVSWPDTTAVSGTCSASPVLQGGVLCRIKRNDAHLRAAVMRDEGGRGQASGSSGWGRRGRRGAGTPAWGVDPG